MRTYIFLIASLLVFENKAQEFYKASDFTAEKLFTSDIEGPRMET